MSITGTWELEIRTPIGRQQARLVFMPLFDGWAGVAHGSEGAIVLTDVTLVGDRLTWAHSITRPMRLDMQFDVTLIGDSMAGTAKAGRLPKSMVTGLRLTSEPSPPPEPRSFVSD